MLERNTRRDVRKTKNKSYYTELCAQENAQQGEEEKLLRIKAKPVFNRELNKHNKAVEKSKRSLCMNNEPKKKHTAASINWSCWTCCFFLSYTSLGARRSLYGVTVGSARPWVSRGHSRVCVSLLLRSLLGFLFFGHFLVLTISLRLRCVSFLVLNLSSWASCVLSISNENK